MAKADLEIIRGLAQAAGNLYDGALDNDGKPLTIGLNREDLPDINRKMIDGVKIGFAGDQLKLTYEAEITLRDVYKNGANAFQAEIDGKLKKIIEYIKKNYRAIANKSVSLTPVEKESKVKIDYVNRHRVLACAVQYYKIGGLSEILAVSEKERKNREISDTYRKFLELGGLGTRPKNDTRPKNA